jgi:uncharacterized protein YggL (DUF469 family)
MTSLSYDNVYSRFLSIVEAYDFLEMPEENVYMFLSEWLHSVIANPYVRRLFNKVNVYDEVQEIKYEMRYSVDEDTDKEFIKEVLSLGLIIAWLEPKINSLNNIIQMYGSKEEKFYSQSQHLMELQALKKATEKKQRGMVADRGHAWNTYLDGANRNNA